MFNLILVMLFGILWLDGLDIIMCLVHVALGCCHERQ